MANFGANLQALSTYRYLQKSGHDPIFIHYMSKQLYERTDGCYNTNDQIKAHLDFIDSQILSQTETCFTADDINKVIDNYKIEGIIVGSDAVLQHHPLLSRVYLNGSRFNRHIFIEEVNDERLFPNLFWGSGINPSIKRVYMSVSSQNSEYKYFTPWLKRDMKKTISGCPYISVRDLWTQNMLKCITNVEYPITPDPVFAFNYNCSEIIPTKEYILHKFGLPEKYTLLSFLNLNIPTNIIHNLKTLFKNNPCVALPSPIGIRFKHDYDYEVSLPLSPIDWYALIKYSHAYIGNNMHPIVVALSNGVPCYSVDNYSNYNFLRHPKNDGSSKILDLLRKFGLQNNYIVPFRNNTINLDKDIFKAIESFPVERVLKKSCNLYYEYEEMMDDILKALQK
ncbi:MAG: polysaccharide pyruvyl transferase family protein [Clostridia bacterium]|nr:polysaccharide pyruvyl transferase family protein [Clostridia bacterium]